MHFNDSIKKSRMHYNAINDKTANHCYRIGTWIKFHRQRRCSIICILWIAIDIQSDRQIELLLNIFHSIQPFLSLSLHLSLSRARASALCFIVNFLDFCHTNRSISFSIQRRAECSNDNARFVDWHSCDHSVKFVSTCISFSMATTTTTNGEFHSTSRII